MKNVIFISIILILCLCLAVVSCADKEESQTTSSSYVDGSLTDYMKIGNMLIVWGSGNTDGNDEVKTVNFPVSFYETPSVTANTVHTPDGYVSSSGDNVRINDVTTSTASIYISNARNFTYIAIGKWH